VKFAGSPFIGLKDLKDKQPLVEKIEFATEETGNFGDRLVLTFESGKRESTGPMPLEMSYTAAGHGYINAEVAKHIDEVQIFELNANLQQAILNAKCIGFDQDC
jgi:hypothetical protein